MTNGRAKGSVAEREVAGLLRDWWRLVDPGAEFVRTPLSGGWSTAKVRGDMRASGDVMTTSRSFPFAVEVKRREGFAWASLLKGRRSPVWSWWAQTVTAAREQQAIPMLWVRRNGEPWRVVLPCLVVDEWVRPRFVHARLVSPRDNLPDVCVIAAPAVLAVHPALLVARYGNG